MNVALWIVQGLLALAFGMGGAMKLITPIPELMEAGMGGWVADSTELLIRFIGLSEVLGAVGLILPAATGIQSWLTPTAAGGLVMVMVLGAGTHASYGEFAALPPNVVLGALAGFVVWGRAMKAPIAPSAPAAANPG